MQKFKNISEAIFSYKKTSSNNIAIVDKNGTRQTSWKELFLLACKIANYATQKKLKGILPVVQDRTMEYVATVLGLNLAGIGVAPLTLDYPVARIEFIKNDLDAPLLADKEFVESAKKNNAWDFLPQGELNSIAFVFYTSGSTGNPKGVIYDNDVVLKAFVRGSSIYELSDSSIVASCSSFNFCASIADLFTPLFNESQVHILSDECRKDISLFENYLLTHSITFAYISPRILKKTSLELPQLKTVITAGEKVYGIKPKNYKIFVLYGMTETVSLVSCFLLDKTYDNTPIGKPLPNMEIFLLDEKGNLSDEGEICVSGDVAKGYWNLPELTERVFVRNYFSSDIYGKGASENKILLHTGDIAKRLPDGNLVFQNRKDWMVKINGQRVEPSEVELQIKKIDCITDAIVKGFENSYGQTYLAAWYVSKKPIDEKIIKNHLANNLPSYMIPTFIFHSENFPINENGKVDRKLFLAPPDVSSFKNKYESPKTEIEKFVCNAFSKVLNIESIGLDDDFFVLGGDSILAVSLCAELKKYAIKTFQVFEGRTPKKIATYCQQKNSTESLSFFSSKKNILSDEEKYSSFPLTSGQVGIYYACIQNSTSLMYNIPFCFSCSLNVDDKKLECAIQKVVKTYSAFSACFKIIDDEVRMLKKEAYAEIKKIIAVEKNISEIKKSFVKPFDLEKGELARFLICKTEKALWLLVDFHHIVFDGTSVGILLNAISNEYEGKGCEAEELSIFQVALLEQEAISSEESKNAYEFFKNNFVGNDYEDSLMSDFLETNDNSFGISKTVDTYFNEDVNSTTVENYVRQAGITEAIFFMGAFAVTASYMTASSGFNFCTVNNGRHLEELNKTIGMFVRTLPLLVSIDDNLFPKKFLAEFSKLFYETMQNDSCPFSKLASEFNILNNTMFVYHGESLNGFYLDEKYIELQTLDTGCALSKLVVHVFKQGELYKASIQYRSDLYSSQKIDSLISIFKNVVSSFLKEVRLSEIPLVTKSQIEMLESFHGLKTNYKNCSVVELLQEGFLKNPDKVAIVSGNTKINFSELNKITDYLAQTIVKKRIGTEDVVAILCERNEMMAICPIAVVKAGAIFQPLDNTYPSERLTFMVKDSKAKLLICPKKLRHLVDTEIETIFIDDFFSSDKKKSKEEDFSGLPSPSYSDGFVVFYTSGTTGLPKGCVLEHKNIVQFINSYVKWASLTENSRVPAYASFGFDANVWDTFPTLCVGATLYIIPYEMRLDLSTLNQYFEDNGITHAFLTTQIGRQFATEYKNKSLKLLTTGGEALTPCEPPAEYDFVNVYGPTETTCIVTQFLVDKYYHSVPIGKPLDGVNLYVVDKNLRRVPVGVPGELCIAGLQVARGYLNQPEKTAEVFIKNPFVDLENNISSEKNIAYERMYRTGDIVRFLPDGNIQFIGRNDGQVKIRGFRIELTEVEEIIRRFEKITDVTVKAFDDIDGMKFIVAYVVSDVKIDIEKLNEFIRAKKPSYMVPALAMQIESIPLNQNGKVNIKALPQPVRDVENIVKPKNKIQEKIFLLLVDVLGHEKFGITTNIFDAGINSISSVKLIFMLSKEFDKIFLIKELKENNTIEKLEKLLNKKTNKDDFKIQQTYPLTKTQEGIFFECLNKPNSTFYNIPYLIRLGKKVNIQKLKRAIVNTINAHPYVMTTMFLTEDGAFCNRDKDAHFSISDIEEIVLKEIDDIETIKKDICKPFNLNGGRLFRIAIIIDKSKNCFWFYFDFHHIIFDGFSLGIFIEDVSCSYNGKELQIEKFSCFEVELQEQKNRSTNALEKSKLYYSNLFKDCETSSLPYGDYPDKNGFASQSFSTEKLSIEELKLFCTKNKITQNTFFTASFGFLLAKYQNDNKAVFASFYNGRDDSRITRSISMFVKTIPVLCDVSILKTVDYLQCIAAQLENSRLNDLYSFEEISHDLGITADVMFVFQDQINNSELFCNEKLCAERIDIDSEKATLSVSVTVKNDSVIFDVEYDNSRYSTEYIESFIRTYELILIGMFSEKKLDDISLVDEKTIKVLESFHGKDSDLKKCTILDLLNEGFSKNPDKIAVVSGNKKISYRELNKITDNLATIILNKGICKEDVVAILSDRNEMMAICPIAVIKTGAMFQPLDNTYPVERLTFMVEDSNAKLLICPKSLRYLIECDVETLFMEDIFTFQNIENGKQLCEIKLSPNNAFVILYTSGSTGKPKGCVLEHKNFAHFLQFFNKRFDISESSNIAAYASFGFDQSVNDLFCTIIAGATMHIIPFDMRLDLIALNEYFEKSKITHAFMTTQVGRQFTTVIQNNSLKYLIMGGETLTPLVPPKNYTIVNGYGPTETTCGVTVFNVDRLYHSVPLGKFNDGINGYILDKNLHRVPIGVPGELYIAGPQVSRGYLNRPDKTDEYFVSNPFVEKVKENFDYEKMYRTGDVVCFLPDGKLQFIGRRDSQVKIRGFRIELTEVESIIRRFKKIKDATVVAYDEDNGGKYLAGYVVSDEKVDIEELKDFIRLEKPAYMVPSVIMQIKEIPLTQNQKVDRRLLPQPIKLAKNYVAPKNQCEDDFCQIMGATLGIKEYSAVDDFFEIGGSSILATKVLVTALTKGYKISYADLFKYASPYKIAKYLIANTNTDEEKISEITNYDYSKINELVAKANIQEIDESIENDSSILKGKLGNIFLTGVTGFLGIHILVTFFKNYDGIVYCMIRKSSEISAEEKLKTMLMFYFSDDFEEMFESGRVRCVETSFEDSLLEEKLKDLSFDTIINCAACVKHFDSGNMLYSVNTLGVKKLLQIAENNNKRFIQISTYSVGGYETEKTANVFFDENKFFINQLLDNEYIRTKFLAERMVLESALRGADVKIIRLGNLMSRYSDGEFQINYITNGFMRDVRGMVALKYSPMQRMHKDIEFSPIDSTATAVLKIADSDFHSYVYHAYNNYSIKVADFVDVCIDVGFSIEIVSEKEYKKQIELATQKYKNNPFMSEVIGGLIAYKNAKTGTEPKAISPKNDFTTQVLYRLGFRWPMVEKNYVSLCIVNLKTLGFFDVDFNKK